MKNKNVSIGFVGSIYFLIIPLIIILIYLLPESTKIALSLNTGNPSLCCLITSGYTHLTFNHFFYNFVIYLFIILFIFYFDSKRDIKLLFLNLILIFLILQIFYSLLSIGLFSYFGKHVLDKGFSTILAGLIGYLPISYVYFLKNKEKIDFKNSYYLLLLFFSFNLSLITLINGWYLVLIILIPFFLICLYLSFHDLQKIQDFFIDLSRKKSFGSLYILIVGMLLCLFAAIGLFPASLKGDSGITNIFAHYVGFVYGFTIPTFVSLKLLKWKK
jgi:hypothetical protein